MSKLMYFDFICRACGSAFEDMIKPDERTAPCPRCGELGDRQVSPVRIDRTAIALTVGASPESIDHFTRIHEQRKKIEEKTFANHGDYGKAPGSD